MIRRFLRMVGRRNVLLSFLLFWTLYTLAIFGYLPYVSESSHTHLRQALAQDKQIPGVIHFNSGNEENTVGQKSKTFVNKNVAPTLPSQEVIENKISHDESLADPGNREIVAGPDLDGHDDDNKRPQNLNNQNAGRDKEPVHVDNEEKQLDPPNDSLNIGHPNGKDELEADRAKLESVLEGKEPGNETEHGNPDAEKDTNTKQDTNPQNEAEGRNLHEPPVSRREEVENKNDESKSDTHTEMHIQQEEKNPLIPPPLLQASNISQEEHAEEKKLDEKKPLLPPGNAEQNKVNEQNPLLPPPVLEAAGSSKEANAEQKNEQREKQKQDDPQLHAAAPIQPAFVPNNVEARNNQQVPQGEENEGHKAIVPPPDVMSNNSNELQVQQAQHVGNAVVEEARQNITSDDDGIVYPKFVERGPPDGPGEGGVAAPWKKETLSPAEQAEWDEGFKHNSFNQFASDRISVHRVVTDNRRQECKERQYPDNIPNCSVVIIFHNEAWSVLLRSVHSVLDNTPSRYLDAVILVDDKSTMAHIGKPLARYWSQYPKVRILRAPERGGLTRARLQGFHNSTSEVVVFLDSHIECTSGWYEPLVEPIVKDYRVSTMPTIDIIDDTTLQFHWRHSSDIGTLDIDMLTFSWFTRPKDAGKITPVDSPTMPGGLFAISRRWFLELGTYDPGLVYWGGENIELSFKVWMCNGSIAWTPCSHVGHIFRKTNPIRWKQGLNPATRNSVRVATVWMDRFRHYFFEAAGKGKDEDIGDISERVALRQRLHCHDFAWYIRNVHPELKRQFDTTSPYAGEVRSHAANICMDSSGKEKKPIVYPCHGYGNNQFWFLTADGSFRQKRSMYLRAENGKMVIKSNSLGTPEWQYNSTSGVIMHVPTGQCLGAGTDLKTLSLVLCGPSKWQRWSMQPRNPELLQPIV